MDGISKPIRSIALGVAVNLDAPPWAPSGESPCKPTLSHGRRIAALNTRPTSVVYHDENPAVGKNHCTDRGCRKQAIRPEQLNIIRTIYVQPSDGRQAFFWAAAKRKPRICGPPVNRFTKGCQFLKQLNDALAIQRILHKRPVEVDVYVNQEGSSRK